MQAVGARWAKGAAAALALTLASLAGAQEAPRQQGGAAGVMVRQTHVRLHTQIIVQNFQRAPEAPMPRRAPMGQIRQARPLPEIVAGVQAREPYRDMDYIGVERFESRTGAYVLRFMDGRHVVVVHVDGRTGRVLDRAP